MKKFLGLAVAMASLATLAVAQEQQPEYEIEYDNGIPVVAGELLVKFRDVDGFEKLRGDSVRLRRYQIRETGGLGRSGFTHLRLTSKQARRRAMAELALDPDVEFVEPNYIVTATAIPNDPSFNQQWGLKNTGTLAGSVAKADIDATTAWETTKGSKANIIGVVDTGIDYTHPDLKDNVWNAPKEFTVTFSATDKITCPAGSHGYNAVLNTCDPKDVAQHGTMVSGVIAAAGNNGVGVSGVNWTGTLIGLGFMDAKGNGSVSAAIRAIEFAIQAKKAAGANIRILNNSWGGPGASQALLAQILKAQEAGMLFVAAAGNSSSNLDTAPEYPAAYTTATNLLAIAATDSKDALATFSSYGAKTVHFGAPGVGIATTLPGNKYGSVSGTSFSAPMTSGVAGLVLAACSALDTAGVRKILVDNTDPVPGMAGKTITGGRLNAYKAVKACTSALKTPSFTVSAVPGSVTLNPGVSANVSVLVTAAGGFTGSVALTVTGLPAGVTGTFTPASATPGTPVVLKLTAAATAGVTTVDAAAVVKGVSGTLSANATLTTSVKPVPTFNLKATPATLTIKKGATASFVFAVELVGSFNQAISLAVTGVPANSTVTLAPTASGQVTLKIVTTTQTAARSYAITATGSAGTLRKTAPVTLVVQ